MTNTAHAYAFPLPIEEEAPRRHLDIAPSRAQRRARPRVYAAIVAIAGIGAILLAQLLMSIVLADGAYQIAALQVEQRDLRREQSAAQEELDQISSTQSLTVNATALGMVASGNPVFLDVAKGKLSGKGSPAVRSAIGSGKNLVLNTLLAGGWTKLGDEVIAAAKGKKHTPSTSDAATGSGSGGSGVAPTPATPGRLPSPTTH